KKLAMRFVSDDPPSALVDRMAQTFLKSDGDIREVLRTMFRSPEFWAPEAYRAKVKTPFEFMVSPLRGTKPETRDPMPTPKALNRMGMPLYGMQPPTGYKMTADAWVNSAALLNRMNTGLQIGSGRMPGATIDVSSLVSGDAGLAPDVLTKLESALLAGD